MKKYKTSRRGFPINGKESLKKMGRWGRRRGRSRKRKGRKGTRGRGGKGKREGGKEGGRKEGKRIRRIFPFELVIPLKAREIFYHHRRHHSLITLAEDVLVMLVNREGYSCVVDEI